MTFRDWMVLAAFVQGCTSDAPKTDDPPAASDADTDTDTDADTDTDTDTDSDTDTGPDDSDGDGVAAGLDCDDTDPEVYPGAPDLCGDDRVTNCDRSSDDGLVTLDGTTGFDDLGAALAAASEGSELLVCPGRYDGNFVATVAVRLRGKAGSGQTILSGAGTGPALVVPGGSAIDGFTLQDGVGDVGGGLVLSSAGTLAVAQCVVTGNQANLGAGIALYEGSDAVISATTIRSNTAVAEGGALWVPAGATADLSGSIVQDNTAGTAGGGASVQAGSLVGGSFIENHCPAGRGGGIALAGGTNVQGSYLEFNTAALGGGMSIRDEAVLTDTSFDENTATAEGGGLECDGCTVVFEGVTVYGSVSDDLGGNVAIRSGQLSGSGVLEDGTAVSGGGIWALDSTIAGVTVWGNRAATGGGVYATGAVGISGAEIQENRADLGGGVAASDAAVTLLECQLETNQAQLAGGGVWLSDTSTLSVLDAAFGLGLDQNQPGDVFAGGTEYAGYGNASSFDCDAAGCSPTP